MASHRSRSAPVLRSRRWARRTPHPGSSRSRTRSPSLRIALIPVFVWLILDHDTTFGGLLLFGAVVSTDWVDGAVARATGQVSELGKVLDPVADRLAIAAGLIALIVRGAFPLWAALLILVRDVAVLVAGIVLLAGRRHLRVDVRYLGKVATFCLMSSDRGGRVGQPRVRLPRRVPGDRLVDVRRRHRGFVRRNGPVRRRHAPGALERVAAIVLGCRTSDAAWRKARWSSPKTFATPRSTSGRATRAMGAFGSGSPTTRRTRSATSSTSMCPRWVPRSPATNRSARSSRRSRSPTCTRPVSGTVSERNALLEDRPELVNEAPYGDGWLVVLQVDAAAGLAELMDAAAYRAFIEQVEPQ